MTTQILSDLNTKCEAALVHLQERFSKIQTGRASAALVEDIMVDSYGAKVPMRSVANISIPDSKQIAIQPWNRDQLSYIEKAIRESDLGLNPQNDGLCIRLNLPPLTEERRKDLVKVMHQTAEESRIALRNVRHDALNTLKALEKNKEIGEDELRNQEKKVQEAIDSYNKRIEELAKKKEADIMTV